MKTLLLLPTFFVALFCTAQTSDSSKLVTRLNEYLVHSKDKNFEKVMDYIHPSLFKISSRKDLADALAKAYSSDEIEISFDSMHIVRISGGFVHNASQYRRVDYFNKMRMTFKDEEMTRDSSFVNILLPSLQTEFPDQEVYFDAKTGAFIVRGDDLLLAIKDPGEEWLFLGYEKGNTMIDSLFPKEVKKHFSIQ